MKNSDACTNCEGAGCNNCLPEPYDSETDTAGYHSPPPTPRTPCKACQGTGRVHLNMYECNRCAGTGWEEPGFEVVAEPVAFAATQIERVR